MGVAPPLTKPARACLQKRPSTLKQLSLRCSAFPPNPDHVVELVVDPVEHFHVCFALRAFLNIRNLDRLQTRLYRRRFVALGDELDERVQRRVPQLAIYRRRDSEELPDLPVLVSDFQNSIFLAVSQRFDLWIKYRNAWNWNRINEMRAVLYLTLALFAKHHRSFTTVSESLIQYSPARFERENCAKARPEWFQRGNPEDWRGEEPFLAGSPWHGFLTQQGRQIPKVLQPESTGSTGGSAGMI